MSRTRSAKGRTWLALDPLEARDLPSFLPPVSYPVGQYTSVPVVAELNGDGHGDVAVTLYYEGKVAVLLGNGDGTLQAPVTFSTGPYPVGLRVADLNLDGKPDLVTANFGDYEGTTVSVLLGNGDGTFQSQKQFATGLGPYQVAVGDLNGDAKPDLAVTNLADGPSTASVLLGNGDGTFQPAVTYFVGGSPIGVEVGDLDGDGIGDLTIDSNY